MAISQPSPLPASRSVSRRRLLGGVLAVPGLAVAAVAGRGLASAAGALRPTGRGATTQRCAQCGAVDHAMLAAACPAAPKVL